MERQVSRRRSASLVAWLAAGLGALAGCSVRTLPREPEILVYVDTDAPLALAPGERLAALTPTPLFDRLRIEVVDANGEPACDKCTEDFTVDDAALAAGRLSFGVLPRTSKPLFARARLFRGVRARGDVPFAPATIDRLVTLPAPREGELAEVTIFLPLENVGVAADIASPEAPITGRVVAARVHPRAVPAECTAPSTDTSGAAQVCVPGGAYWMSDPVLGIEVNGDDPPERVAVVSPFWLDPGEVTVAAFRASGLGSAPGVGQSDGKPTGCTFTPSPGDKDALPMTCVPWAAASQFCAARGSRLPTEAELELAMGARRSRRAPWGEDYPECEDAVIARADAAKLDPAEYALAACAQLGVGPAPRGSGRRDVLSLPTGDIFDLLGNVSEWASDEGAPMPSACWGYGTVFDPVCTLSPPTTDRVVRGDSYGYNLTNVRSTTRLIVASRSPGLPARIGFRCARDGT